MPTASDTVILTAAVPPAGVLGWYDDLLGRAAEQPGLIDDIQAARSAVQKFDGWLKEKRPGWTASAGVGEAAFDWYLKHVKLMPWTSAELVVLGQRELDRLWAIYALERHRNRELPELEPPPAPRNTSSALPTPTAVFAVPGGAADHHRSG